MSSLYVQRNIKEFLSDDLKYKIKEKFCLPYKVDKFDQNFNGFLDGLIVCGVKDAEKLKEYISKYDEVEIVEVW